LLLWHWLDSQQTPPQQTWPFAQAVAPQQTLLFDAQKGTEQVVQHCWLDEQAPLPQHIFPLEAQKGLKPLWLQQVWVEPHEVLPLVLPQHLFPRLAQKGLYPA
jgi:hypothetical protein